MPIDARKFFSAGLIAGFAIGAASSTGQAQDDAWRTLVQEADSIGPETPAFAPSSWTPCASAPAADSVRLSGPSDEFLFAARSRRTRGYFAYRDVPENGSGSFALRAILCDEDTGRPRTFVLERDQRYFYVVFPLREVSSYDAVTLFSSGTGTCLRWAAAPGRFAPAPCRGTVGAKC